MNEEEYRCKDGDMLDAIVWRRYGADAVKGGAVEFILNYNQNLSRKSLHTEAGQIILLPKNLPSYVYNSLTSNKVKVF